MPIGFALVKGLETLQIVPGAALGSLTPPGYVANNPNANPLTNVSSYHGILLPQEIYGRNPAVASQADIYYGNAVKAYPTAGYTLAVSSDSANDTSAGTGARTVLVRFLDALWVPHTALFTLNGQTLVNTPTQVDGIANVAGQTAMRINGMEVTTVGTGLVNAGNIYGFDNSSGVTGGVPTTMAKCFDVIAVGDNISAPGSFSVPAGYRFILQAAIPSFDDITTTVKYGSVRMAQSCNCTAPGQAPIFQSKLLGQLTSQSGTNLIEFEQFPIVEAYNDIKFSGAASAAAVMSVVATGMLWQL